MTPAQQKMADAMPESELQEAVIARMEVRGIRTWHDMDARRDRPGLPDLIAVGKEVLWIELKSQRGRLRTEQEAFMTDLLNAGQHVLLWRPENLYDGAVDRAINRIALR